MSNEIQTTQEVRQFTISLPQYAREFFCTVEESVLNAALKQGLIIANSCRNGTCRTCLCRLQSGEIEYLIEWPGLSFDEKAEGYILPCVAKPLSDLVLHDLVLSQT
ncbi:2Fe-2S iron-sulfur cluster-binding protein [Undibacterium sp.]|uniref:2Fe-2S iron-sulfur cluster-binding protein n=1 Tax=Undibacterium sp. TaxID=1914977 RepID=UPI003750E84D